MKVTRWPLSCQALLSYTTSWDNTIRRLTLLALTLLAIALAACQSSPKTATSDFDAAVGAAVEATVTAESSLRSVEGDNRRSDGRSTPEPTSTATPAPAPTFAPTPGPTSTAIPTPPATIAPAPGPASTATPTPAPTTAPTPTPTPRPTPTPTARERLGIEQLSQIVPWFADPPDNWHAEAVTALTKTWARDPGLGDAVARVPWVNDGIRVDEIRTMWYVRDRALHNPALGYAPARYWLDAGPSRTDVRMAHLEMLVLIADAVDHNPALAQALKDLPEITGNVMSDPEMSFHLVQVADRSVESALAAAAFVNRDVSAGRPLLVSLSSWATDSPTSERFDRLIAAPWFVDGLNDAEAALVVALIGASRDSELYDDLLKTGPTAAMADVAELLPWADLALTNSERRAFEAIVSLWELDSSLGVTVAQYPWVEDGVDGAESWSLSHLAAIGGSDLEAARRAAAWVAGGAGRNEEDSLSVLAALADLDHQFTGQALRHLTSRERDLGQYLLQSLGRMADAYPEDFKQLIAQSWFADGLEDSEAALVTILGNTVSRDSTFYDDLLEAHFSQARTVSLPLAGDVNIWIFQTTPFPPNDDLLTIIEDTARMSEELLGAPFPTTDIILLVFDPSIKRYRVELDTSTAIW